MSGDTPGWFDLEPLLITRLDAPVTALGAKVLSMAEFGGAKEDSLPKPSVRCVFSSYSVSSDPSQSTIEQIWMTVIAVKNVRDVRTGTAVRNAAAPLVDTVFDLLDHWRIGGGLKLMLPTNPPVRSAIFQGTLFVPLAWKTAFVRTNQNN